MELNKTIQFYFRQPALESVSIPELQKAILKYPYCASLHFLLLKKQREEKDPGFSGQFEKTTLFFTNPFHLKAQLTSKDFRQQVIPVHQQKAAEEPVAQPEMETELEIKSQPEPVEVTNPPEEAPERTPFTATEPVNEAQPITDSPDKTGESGQKPVSESFPPTPEPELRTDLLRMESPIPIPSIRDLSPQTDDTPVFEPYHTIDYFASQGIKLSQDQPANDRLGRQLKSFTEWIKTMKRLPQPHLEAQLMEAGNGDRIVAMAAGSVEHREVLTETMAEVLVKQGNIEKAVDLYRKLSLAHPDKSTYFAARIEQLKNR